MSNRCDDGCGLAQFPKGHATTTEADVQDMMAVLYAEGFSYAAIADLCGRTHTELRDLLLRNFPGRVR